MWHEFWLAFWYGPTGKITLLVLALLVASVLWQGFKHEKWFEAAEKAWYGLWVLVILTALGFSAFALKAASDWHFAFTPPKLEIARLLSVVGFSLFAVVLFSIILIALRLMHRTPQRVEAVFGAEADHEEAGEEEEGEEEEEEGEDEDEAEAPEVPVAAPAPAPIPVPTTPAGGAELGLLGPRPASHPTGPAPRPRAETDFWASSGLVRPEDV